MKSDGVLGKDACVVFVCTKKKTYTKSSNITLYYAIGCHSMISSFFLNFVFSECIKTSKELGKKETN